ncbi:MAG: hypothetical protein COB08_012375 [Rhodobacteraceae bacterium]|nr:hypothetical protein [Paracoccaceae bacterium]
MCAKSLLSKTILFLGLPFCASAEPTALECSYDGYSNIFQLSINLDTMQLKLGKEFGFWYPIVSFSENYITALGRGITFAGEDEWENPPAHGGDIFVVNRITGSLYWASVGGTCTTGTSGDCEQGSMNALGQSGQCRTKLF